MRQLLRKTGDWLKKEEGIGTLEIILIVAVLVIIAVAFRKWILAWVQKLFDTANDELKKTDQDGLVVPSPG